MLAIAKMFTIINYMSPHNHISAPNVHKWLYEYLSLLKTVSQNNDWNHLRVLLKTVRKLLRRSQSSKNGSQMTEMFTSIYENLSLLKTVHKLALRCQPSANCACAEPLIDGLGFLCLRSWYPASSSQRVWHGLATVVDSKREAIHALRCDSLCFQDTQSDRTQSR